VYFCRKSTDLSWEGDEPSTAVAEEEAVPPADESAPTPQAESEVPAAGAALPEASVVEGEYSVEAIVPPHRVVVVGNALVFFLTGAEAEGNDIPTMVPMQNLTPQGLEAAEEAAVATGGEEATVPPEAALEVVFRSP
jgi:hypothetical protein